MLDQVTLDQVMVITCFARDHHYPCRGFTTHHIPVPRATSKTKAATRAEEMAQTGPAIQIVKRRQLREREAKELQASKEGSVPQSFPRLSETTTSEIEMVESSKIAPTTRTSRIKAAAGRAEETGPAWAQAMIQMIQSLRETQALMSRELKETRGELQKTRNELSTELQKTRTELTDAQEQLRIIKLNQEQQSPCLSYAEAAKTPPTSSPSNLRSRSTKSPAPLHHLRQLSVAIGHERLCRSRPRSPASPSFRSRQHAHPRRSSRGREGRWQRRGVFCQVGRNGHQRARVAVVRGERRPSHEACPRQLRRSSCRVPHRGRVQQPAARRSRYVAALGPLVVFRTLYGQKTSVCGHRRARGPKKAQNVGLNGQSRNQGRCNGPRPNSRLG